MATRRSVDELAAAILDGAEVDWDAAEAAVPIHERELLRQLHVVARIADAHRTHQPAKPPPASWAHLQVLEQIGSGAFGDVYRAWDRRLDREVALKLLRAGGVPADGTVIAEASMLARVRHPNVVTIHGAERVDGRVGLWMELVKGRGLDQVVREQGPLGPHEAALIGLSVCGALAAVHAAGLLHRDVKAQNVMREDRGRIVLMDFGTGRHVPSPETSRARARLAGTPLYLAPELLAGGEPSVSSDIYSVGVLLFHLVTGSFPVQAETIPSLRAAHESRRRRLLRDQRPDLPEQFVSAVETATDPDPGRRFRSAGALELSLSQAMGARSGNLTGWRRRGRGAIFALAAATSVVLVAAALVPKFGRLSPGSKVPEIAPVSAMDGVTSIAVLPFVDTSPARDQEYFSDGLSDEILNMLARNPALHVAARTSSFQFRGNAADIAAIGRRLNVETILEGSVRKSGRRVRITAQLVKVADGYTLWSETYDRELDDVFAVQEGIARAVSAELNTTLVEQSGSWKVRKGGFEAYNLYLQGKYFGTRRSRESLERACVYFEKSLRLDSDYPPAWTGLAQVHITQARLGYTSPSEGFQSARQELERAFALDPRYPDAHAELGTILLSFDWDWSGADAACTRALELQARNREALVCAARVANAFGRFDEAIALYNRAIAIDPLSANIYVSLGGAWASRGKPKEGEHAFQKALELDPGYPGAHFSLGIVRLMVSEPQAALREMEKEDESMWRREGLALAYHALGRKVDADAALAKLVAMDERHHAIQIAGVHAFRGEPDQAFHYLELARARRDPGLTSLKGFPLFKTLENDRRYKALLASMRLPV